MSMGEAEVEVEVEASEKRGKRPWVARAEAPLPKKRPKQSWAEGLRERLRLHGDDKAQAVAELKERLAGAEGMVAAAEYLAAGGSGRDVLVALEGEGGVAPAAALDVAAALVEATAATSDGGASRRAAADACRYALTHHEATLRKALGLASARADRLAALRLLAAAVALEPQRLARPALQAVAPHSASLELLTREAAERRSLARLLRALLQTRAGATALTDHPALVAAAVRGLARDQADTAAPLLDALRSGLVERPNGISRTAKMKVFSTGVLRDLVALYNWRGNADGEDGALEQARVRGAAHALLRALCASHETGVVFHDPLLGLGRTSRNALVFTVLRSMHAPWRHSYAAHLVLDICAACPDLAKTVWSDLCESLEPRPSEQWQAAASFASRLVRALGPRCVGAYARALAPPQQAQLVQILAAPLPALRVLRPRPDADPAMRLPVLGLLRDMLASVRAHLDALASPPASALTAHYLLRNLPTAHDLIALAPQTDDKMDYLNVAMDVLNHYQRLAPKLLDMLQVPEIWDCFLNTFNLGEDTKTQDLQLKIVSLIMDFDSSWLLPKTDAYDLVMPLLLLRYHSNPNIKLFEIILKITLNSGVFEGSKEEAPIWINGMLNMPSPLTPETATLVSNLVKYCSENLLNLQHSLDTTSICDKIDSDFTKIIQELQDQNLSSAERSLRQKSLSPMMVWFCQNKNKQLARYAEFVFLRLFHQYEGLEFVAITDKWAHVLPKNIRNYIESWRGGQGVHLQQIKGQIGEIRIFGEYFLTKEFSENHLVQLSLDAYPNFLYDVLHEATFYFSHATSFDGDSNIIYKNYELFVTYLAKEKKLDEFCLTIIMTNSNLLKSFSLLKLENKHSETLLNIIEILLKFDYQIEAHLKIYRDKAVKNLSKLCEKPDKYQHMQVGQILSLFKLEYNQCIEIMETISIFIIEEQNNSVVFDVLGYTLDRIAHLCITDSNLTCLNSNFIKNISQYIVKQVKSDFDVTALSNAFEKYLRAFPSNIEFVDSDIYSVMYGSKSILNLSCFLLERTDIDCFDNLKIYLEKTDSSKAILIPILDVFLENNLNNDNLKDIYEILEPSFLKILNKPQKIAQYFQSSKNILSLIERFISPAICCKFFEKVHKFEVSDLFHANLLKIVSIKTINSDMNNEKCIDNIILSFIYLHINIFKREEINFEKLTQICSVFQQILTLLKCCDTAKIFSHESVKIYIKSCLKFGISGHPILLDSVSSLIRYLAPVTPAEEAAMILEMLISHSKFMDVIMSPTNHTKHSAMSLYRWLCFHHGSIMEKRHIPLVLSAYTARRSRCDRTTLSILQMYEGSVAGGFAEYKPLLWGRAAAVHYSVGTGVENALNKQPKVADVLNLLEERWVENTVKAGGVGQTLHAAMDDVEEDVSHVYDLAFLLPLFSQLLAPEMPVRMGVVIRSGLPALATCGLSCEDEGTRRAAAHVLSRLHARMDADAARGDRPLWLRLAAAVGRGAACLPGCRLPGPAALFMARAALALARPHHPLYRPLARFLAAKPHLHLGGVPDLLALLFSPDVEAADHRAFVLRVLRDGLHTDADFRDVANCMVVKLLLELDQSAFADHDTKLMVLQCLCAMCKLPLGCKVLCEGNSVLPRLASMISNIIHNQDNTVDYQIFYQILDILFLILTNKNDKYTFATIFRCTLDIIQSDLFKSFEDNYKKMCFQMLYTIYDKFPQIVSKHHVDYIAINTNDRYCVYFTKYASKYVIENDFVNIDDTFKYLRLLTFKINIPRN